jgi:hypothetical protein
MKLHGSEVGESHARDLLRGFRRHVRLRPDYTGVTY